MILPCDECKKVYDIPDDKWDDYNIYRKWNGIGSAVVCPPILLCPDCSAKRAKEDSDNGQ